MTMIHKFTKYNYLIHGIEIGVANSSFENCHIVDREMTEQEVLALISADYIQKGYVATSAKLDYTEEVTIKLLTNEVIISERVY